MTNSKAQGDYKITTDWPWNSTLTLQTRKPKHVYILAGINIWPCSYLLHVEIVTLPCSNECEKMLIVLLNSKIQYITAYYFTLELLNGLELTLCEMTWLKCLSVPGTLIG